MIEVAGQTPQMAFMHAALPRLGITVHMIHGDQDDFAPLDVANRFSQRGDTRHAMRFDRVSGANHFLNDGPVETLLGALESCIPPETARRRWTWPKISTFSFARPLQPA